MTFKRLTFGMLAFVAWGGALAASPAAPQTPGQPSAGPVVPSASVQPGVISSLKAQPAETDAGKLVRFVVEGSGYCKVTLAMGDGTERTIGGNLPLSTDYAYSTNTMTTYEAFRVFTATARPVPSCRTAAGNIPETKVRIANPGVQPMQGPASGNPPVSASPATVNGVQNNLGGKDGNRRP